MGRLEKQAWAWAEAKRALEGQVAGRAGMDLGQECVVGGSWVTPTVSVILPKSGRNGRSYWLGRKHGPLWQGWGEGA